MDIASLFTNAIAQAQQKQIARQANYNVPQAQRDADGDIPLDHPALAGSNPIIDALIAEASANQRYQEAAAQQQVGGQSPLDFAHLWLQEPQGAQGALNQIANLPGASSNMPYANDPASVLQALAVNANNPADIMSALLGQQAVPVQAPTQAQAAPAAMPAQTQQTSVGSELYQMPSQEFESAPSIGDILNEAGQTQSSPTGAQSTEVSLASYLNDPGLARLLLSMGSSLTQGQSFATALESGIRTKDAFDTVRVNAAHEAKKREADLTKTSAEIVEKIANAGKAEADAENAKATARKSTVEAGMLGYKAETDRIKANASRVSANAAYKQATLDVEKDLRALTGGEPLSDKEYSTVFADILNATQGNIILNQELSAKGMSAREFTTMMMNQTVKDPKDHRYIPLTSSRAAAIRQENEKINNLPDTPENQKLSADFQKKIIEDFTYIYGAEALYKAMQGK